MNPRRARLMKHTGKQLGETPQMPRHFCALGVSIELAAGWSAEVCQDAVSGETTEFLLISPEGNDAALRITPFDDRIMDADKWVEMVGRINRSMGRCVSSARCGDFAGYVFEFCTPGERLRGWALRADRVPVDANYRCKLEIGDRDDPIIDSMMSSLGVNVRSESGG